RFVGSCLRLEARVVPIRRPGVAEQTRGLSSRARLAPWPTSLGNVEVILLNLDLAWSRWSRGLPSALVSRHGGPDEPHQLTRDRRHGHRRSLAVANKVAIAAM